MKRLGENLGRLLHGGETIELVGDVGAGKTTLVKGIAKGMAIDEDVQSPSFTISRVYDTPENIRLAHYDFYRLHDAGIMTDELYEAVHDALTVTIVEWAEVAVGVLPEDLLTISITSPTEVTRHVVLKGNGEKSKKLLEALA